MNQREKKNRRTETFVCIEHCIGGVTKQSTYHSWPTVVSENIFKLFWVSFEELSKDFAQFEFNVIYVQPLERRPLFIQSKQIITDYVSHKKLFMYIEGSAMKDVNTSILQWLQFH